MQVKYRLIHLGRVIAEQVKDMDGNDEINEHRVQSDIYEGNDP